MKIQYRLDSLLHRELIDAEIIRLTLELKQTLKDWYIDVDTGQVELLLVHFAMALGRIKRGYVAQPLFPSFFTEITQAETFQQILVLHQIILDKIPFTIPESEQTHFIANLYSLSLGQPQLLNYFK